ncbi:MAG TPA: YtxH domain-containing protein [Ferruginibacter sp.]|nr:YtxH domain-containing protein [Ferruginibacter sp.]
MANGKLIAGILVGIAAGAVLGVLFAPEKGEETRKKIKKRAAKMGEDLKAKFDDVAEEVKKKMSDIKNDADDYFEKSQHNA